VIMKVQISFSKDNSTTLAYTNTLPEILQKQQTICQVINDY